MFPLNATTLAAIALSFGVALGGAYIKGRGDGRALAYADQAREAALVREAKDEAMRVTAEAIGKIEVKQVTIRQTLEREIHEKPVYMDCRHTPDGLRLVNAAITGQEPVAAGGGELPRLGRPD